MAARRAAALLSITAALLAVVAVWAAVASGFTSATGESAGSDPIQQVIDPILGLALVVGASLILARQPRNLIAWILLLIGVGWVVEAAGGRLATYSYVEGDPLVELSVVADAMFAVFLAALAAIFMLFPQGEIDGRWRRILLTAVVAAGVIAVIATLLRADLHYFEVDPTLTNPWQVGGTWMGLVGDVAFPAQLVLAGVAIVSFVVRAYRSSGLERQQFKWVALAGAATVLGTIVAIVGDALGTDWGIAFRIGVVLIPVSIMIAVTRYRLYDIDRLINRTVVYALVVAVLGLVFVAGAVWLPSLLPFEDNNLAIAATTLAVFFLFDPLRRRAQRFVDHRFYRSRYDVQRVADEFSARLRDQVDPDAVAGEWVEVVQRTLQPAAVSVWVREEA